MNHRCARLFFSACFVWWSLVLFVSGTFWWIRYITNRTSFEVRCDQVGVLGPAAELPWVREFEASWQLLSVTSRFPSYDFQLLALNGYDKAIVVELLHVEKQERNNSVKIIAYQSSVSNETKLFTCWDPSSLLRLLSLVNPVRMDRTMAACNWSFWTVMWTN